MFLRAWDLILQDMACCCIGIVPLRIQVQEVGMRCRSRHKIERCASSLVQQCVAALKMTGYQREYPRFSGLGCLFRVF